MSFEGLLPDSYEDFRSVKFWDAFFKKRGSKPFEWYGDWRQLKPLLLDKCKNQRILVVGCGNSELSAQMYDDGCQQITNIDFSILVIKNMMLQNLRQRPMMKWQVMDMTNMKFKAECFDVVLDKGGLDALMGEDSAEGTEAGKKLLSEVSRVLSPTGSYLCITLAQSHVLKLLLRSFTAGWQIRLAPVPPSPDMARSGLQPLFITVTKLDAGGASGSVPAVQSSVRPNPKAPNAEQLAEVCQIVEEENASRASGKSPGILGGQCPPSAFDQLRPGQRVELPLGQAAQGSGKGNARFSAVVLDVAGRVADAALQQCCVFIVPQGRDSEWLFGSEEGQWQVAGQCSSRRVILVTLGREHTFGHTADVQAELSPLVEELAPADLRGIPKGIPIMTTDEGVGHRSQLEQAQSSISGRIAVEDVMVKEGSMERFLRRMVFVSNSNLIQSEAVLRGDSSPATHTSAALKGKRKGGRNGAAAAKEAELLEVDHSCLAMDYHNAIIAGISLIGDSIAKRRPEDGCRGRAMIIGLGGGGLAMFLHRHLEFAVDVVELDEVVVGLAERHFGFSNTHNLQARVGDGLDAVAEAAKGSPGSLDLLIVDAGSGDASLAMSCPPPEFLKAEFMHQARDVLKPGGLLMINCVTRAESAFQSAVQAVKAVSDCVCEVDVEDDLNRVLFAVKGAHGKPSNTELSGHIGKLVHNIQADSSDDICSHIKSLRLL